MSAKLFMTLQACLHCYIAKAHKIPILAMLLLFYWIIYLSPNPAYAQNTATQKKVVSTYQIDNPNQLFLFPNSDCPDKFRGDANCDNQINLFDLSIWQIETNSGSGSMADFNNDGFVNLFDFAVWKETYYGPAKPVGPTALNIFSRIFNFSVNAQSSAQNTVTHSQAVTSLNNSSTVFNTNSDGTNSQVQFDASSNPVSAVQLDLSGNPQTQATFLKTGDEVITGFQDGITIQTLRKLEGPVFQFFSSNGQTLAVKSWPSLESIVNNDPPVAVTLPTKNGKYLTLSINPNGTSIFTQTDSQGNIIAQSQSRPSGVYISQDLRLNIQTETNTKAGLSTIQMPNSLGGNTTYHLYKAGLFAVVQTDKDNNYFVAKPLDTTGDSWKLTSNVGGQESEKTVSDPISEVGSNTPNPKEIVAGLNYYKSLPQALNTLSFQDGFGSNSKILPDQLTQGNDILKIETAPSPNLQANNILDSLIKYAYALDADQVVQNPRENNDNRGNSRGRTGGDDDSRSNSAGSAAAAAAPAATSQAQIGTGGNNGTVTVSGGTQTAQVTNSSGATVATGTTTASGNNTTGSGSSSTNVNFDVISRVIPIGSGGTPALGTPVATPPQEMKGTCFLAGTLISTPKGPQAIETLKPGDKVYSYNLENNRKEVSALGELDINPATEYLIINNKLNITKYHPTFIKTATGLKNLRADELKPGDELISDNGKTITVTSIASVKAKTTVYNLLRVTPNNNFFAEGILVHNSNYDNIPTDPVDPGIGHEEQPSYDVSITPSQTEESQSESNSQGGYSEAE